MNVARNAFPLGARLLANSLLIGSLLSSALAPVRAFTQNPATVFINEIHYDNTGADAGEAIEIAGPAGTNLSGYSLVLYNGATSTAAVTYDSRNLSGTIPDQQNGFGTVSIAIAGIQNGTADGIALVGPNNTVIQLLSYEGTFQASNGPAAGLTSTDIGVSESGTEPLGLSLRLTGVGSTYQDFTWASAATASFGQVNSNQTFTGTQAAALSLSVTPSTFSEAAGAAAAVGTVTRTGSTAADLVVTLASADPSEALVGTTVTIPAGALSAGFNVDAVDDTLVDGSQTVAISATATDFIAGSANVTVTDNDVVVPVTARIRQIQGAAHVSPLVGQSVTGVSGIVTAIRPASGNARGFYLQDPSPDTNDATSEGILVFTGSTTPVLSNGQPVAIGQAVTVSGTVTEFTSSSRPDDLSNTEITAPTVNLVSAANPLPTPVTIGAGGRVPPGEVIEDDATNVNTDGVFDPASDGIDFYESLEGMRVQLNNPVASGPTSLFSAGSANENREISVLPDGAGSVRTNRGGIIVRPNDFNPERVFLGDILGGGAPDLPDIDVNDRFTGTVTGVLDYSFSNFKLYVSDPLPTLVPGGLAREIAADPTATSDLSIATFNVENLSPNDDPAKFSGLAAAIVGNLKSPDIVSIEEVQDNNGATNDAVVDATTTLNTLIAAIQAAGGPTYQFRQINPVDDQDGGQPGGNIRVAFLFNPNRVSFVDRPAPAGTDLSITPVGVTSGESGLQLTFSPGRIEPTNPAFNSSRKPLVGEFLFNGRRLFVVGNHFNSKGGDQPLFGVNQPPVLSSETQRNQQATLVNQFVRTLLNGDPSANVAVLGDLNDFPFSNPLTTLKSGGVLNNLLETLPPEEAYTYVFEGNSQALDHILVSDSLLPIATVDVIHFNSEFADQLSDHDPLVSRLSLPQAALSVASLSPTSGPVGTTVTITGTGFVSGSTTVLFANGVSATPVAVNGNGTQIVVAVPSGAVTGRLQVRTPAGRTSSPVKFVVP